MSSKLNGARSCSTSRTPGRRSSFASARTARSRSPCQEAPVPCDKTTERQSIFLISLVGGTRPACVQLEKESLQSPEHHQGPRARVAHTTNSNDRLLESDIRREPSSTRPPGSQSHAPTRRRVFFICGGRQVKSHHAMEDERYWLPKPCQPFLIGNKKRRNILNKRPTKYVTLYKSFIVLAMPRSCLLSYISFEIVAHYVIAGSEVL